MPQVAQMKADQAATQTNAQLRAHAAAAKSGPTPGGAPGGGPGGGITWRRGIFMTEGVRGEGGIISSIDAGADGLTVTLHLTVDI